MVPVQRSAAWNDREQLDLCIQLLIDSLEFVLKHAVVSLEVFDVDISLNCEWLSHDHGAFTCLMRLARSTGNSLGDSALVSRIHQASNVRVRLKAIVNSSTSKDVGDIYITRLHFSTLLDCQSVLWEWSVGPISKNYYIFNVLTNMMFLLHKHRKVLVISMFGNIKRKCCINNDQISFSNVGQDHIQCHLSSFANTTVLGFIIVDDWTTIRLHVNDFVFISRDVLDLHRDKRLIRSECQCFLCVLRGWATETDNSLAFLYDVREPVNLVTECIVTHSSWNSVISSFLYFSFHGVFGRLLDVSYTGWIEFWTTLFPTTFTLSRFPIFNRYRSLAMFFIFMCKRCSK